MIVPYRAAGDGVLRGFEATDNENGRSAGLVSDEYCKTEKPERQLECNGVTPWRMVSYLLRE